MERKLTGILLDTVPYFLIALPVWFLFQKLGPAEGGIIVSAIAAIGWCIAKFVIDPVKRIRNRYS